MSNFNSLQDFLDSLSPSPNNSIAMMDYVAARRASEFRWKLLNFIDTSNYELDSLNKKILSIVDIVFRKWNHHDMKVATTDFIKQVIEAITENDSMTEFSGLKSEVVGIIGEALFIARENFADLIEKAIANEDDELDIDTLDDRQFIALSVLRHISENSKHAA